MPRLKDKPPELNEEQFVDWLIEIYYYRVMDKGVSPSLTPLVSGSSNEEKSTAFLQTVRAQLTRFDLAFPLTKLEVLYKEALRQISINPARKQVSDKKEDSVEFFKEKPSENLASPNISSSTVQKTSQPDTKTNI
jgi:hypothetical protein